MKVRGTASHIAEKYAALARDALSSGDPVSAENYFQHAEHYYRIVMAAQAQFQQSQPQSFRGDEDEEGPERGDGRYGWDGAPRDARYDDESDEDEQPMRPSREDAARQHRAEQPRQPRDDMGRQNRDRHPARDNAPPQPREAATPPAEPGYSRGDNGGQRRPPAVEARDDVAAPDEAGAAMQRPADDDMPDGERRRAPRRRRPKPAMPGEAAADETPGVTRDGEAALAAFSSD